MAVRTHRINAWMGLGIMVGVGILIGLPTSAIAHSLTKPKALALRPKDVPRMQFIGSKAGSGALGLQYAEQFDSKNGNALVTLVIVVVDSYDNVFDAHLGFDVSQITKDIRHQGYNARSVPCYSEYRANQRHCWESTKRHNSYRIRDDALVRWHRYEYWLTIYGKNNTSESYAEQAIELRQMQRITKGR